MEFIKLYLPLEEEKRIVAENDYQKLFTFGSKIADLMDKPEINTDPNVVGLLDDLLGAVYSLIFARHYTFDNRTDKPVEIQVIKTRATQIQNSEVRIDGKWIAGWHFNSAIYRISSNYHRLLQLITNSSGDIGQLITNAKTQYENWAGVKWNEADVREVQKEVNKLKHRIEGVYSKRNITFQQALDSISRSKFGIVQQICCEYLKYVVPNTPSFSLFLPKLFCLLELISYFLGIRGILVVKKCFQTPENTTVF